MFEKVNLLISQGKLNDAIQILLKSKNSLTEEELNNVVILSSRYHHWKKEYNLGTDIAKTELHKIEDSILQLIANKNKIIPNTNSQNEQTENLMPNNNNNNSNSNVVTVNIGADNETSGDDSNANEGSPKKDRTILIAIIGLIGVLGGALIANWEKINTPKADSKCEVIKSNLLEKKLELSSAQIQKDKAATLIITRDINILEKQLEEFKCPK